MLGVFFQTMIVLLILFPLCVLAGDPDVELHWGPSVLEEVARDNDTLRERIMRVENMICEGQCGRYPHNRRIHRWPSCQTCHCDMMCSVHHDCCPDVLMEQLVNYTRQPATTCEPLVPLADKGRTPHWEEDFTRMTAKCPNDTIDEEIRVKCLKPDIGIFSESMPVYDPEISIVYRNIYCAQCNAANETALSEWSYSIACESTPEILVHMSSSAEDVLQLLATEEGVNATKCRMTYSPKTNGRGKRFCSREKTTELISSCNVTGKVVKIYSDIEEACFMYYSPFLGQYKNMFCYLCNLNMGVVSLEYFRRQVSFGIPATVARLDFAALLNFGGQDEETSVFVDIDTDCPSGQFFDRTACSCKQMKCSLGKYLTRDGQCQSLLRGNLLGYLVCFRITWHYPDNLSEKDVRIFVTIFSSNALYELGHDFSNGFKTYTIKLLVESWCPADKTMTLLLEGQTAIFDSLSAFEEESIQRIKESLLLMAEFTKPSNGASIEVTYDCPTEGIKTTFPCPENNSIQFDVVTANAFLMANNDYPNKFFYVPYHETNKCPYVEVHRNDSSIIRSAIVVAMGDDTIKTNDSIKNILEQVENDLFRICTSDYQQLWHPDVYKCQRQVFVDIWTPTGLVSIVCTCISLFCLLLTFITYVMLPPLRKGGGKTIMFLTVALFIAQALYEFALEQYESRGLCQMFGLLIHYAWLVAVLSMNACTVERFLKLCFPLRSRSFFLSGRPFALSVAYSLLVPACIVTITVVTTYQTEGEFAYGDSYICFINTNMGRILAWAVPLGVLVIVNTTLMIITVCRLSRQKRPGALESSTKVSKVTLVATARLSILTGITWALSFLYDLMNSPEVGYVITTLIASQGLFFFASMILNTRVKNQFMQVWLKGKDKKSTKYIRNTEKRANDETESTPDGQTSKSNSTSQSLGVHTIS